MSDAPVLAVHEPESSMSDMAQAEPTRRASLTPRSARRAKRRTDVSVRGRVLRRIEVCMSSVNVDADKLLLGCTK